MLHKQSVQGPSGRLHAMIRPRIHARSVATIAACRHTSCQHTVAYAMEAPQYAKIWLLTGRSARCKSRTSSTPHSMPGYCCLCRGTCHSMPRYGRLVLTANNGRGNSRSNRKTRGRHRIMLRDATGATATGSSIWNLCASTVCAFCHGVISCEGC